MLLAFPKSIVISQGRSNLLNNAEIFSLMFGLSPVWNRYSKGSHTTWVTKRSVIAYDRIRKE